MVCMGEKYRKLMSTYLCSRTGLTALGFSRTPFNMSLVISFFTSVFFCVASFTSLLFSATTIVCLLSQSI